MIRVLIADDSAFMRKTLSDLFDKASEFEVVGVAVNGKDAIEKVKSLKPNLITMDVNMPVMDGLNALAVIMEENPTPVVMLSSLTQEGADATIRALSLGAVDFIAKPGGSISRVDKIENEILVKCINAAQAKVRKTPNIKAVGEVNVAQADSAKNTTINGMRQLAMPKRAGLKLNKEPDSPLPDKTPTYGIKRKNPLLEPKKPLFVPKAVPSLTASGGGGKKLVAIGVSTGGPQALQQVIPVLPKDLPCGVLVVQHMPASFTKSLAERLDALSAIKVSEAQDGDVIEAGHVYIAPGTYNHMRVKVEGNVRKIELVPDAPVGNHRPAVNVMYDSVASLGKDLVAVIMTGMGADGCEGMKKVKASGGYSIAQDEETSVVYGMPKAVADAGLVDEVQPLSGIANAIVNAVRR